ncbi:hypothetical protein NXS19_014137 [Fusarium pseudograminearum]|nr:hypothetical protein NXS19_014137 [Fusarium pseudograminearum]
MQYDQNIILFEPSHVRLAVVHVGGLKKKSKRGPNDGNCKTFPHDKQMMTADRYKSPVYQAPAFELVKRNIPLPTSRQPRLHLDRLRLALFLAQILD